MAGLAGALVLLLVLPSPAAAFFNASLDVEILVDKPSYQTGDIVNATVDVIWGGTLSDAVYVDLELTVNALTVWTQPIPLTHVSAGVYRGSFPILANLTASGLPWLDLRADASVGAITASAYAMVFVTRSPVLTDHAFLSAYEAAPGQTVNGTLQTYLDGVLADADNVTVSAQLYAPGLPYSSSDLAVRNVSAGTYAFSYTVPTDVNVSASVSFWGSAEVAAIHTTYGLSNLPTLRVDVADPFLVWTHELALGSGHAAFEVWVADPSGSPVAGAGVWVVTRTWGLPFPGGVVSGRAVTDASGRAPFDLAFASGFASRYLYLQGYVTRGSANESFTASIASSAVPPAGFFVQRTNPLDLFEPGEKAVLRFVADFDGGPLAGSVLFYTAYDASSLLTYGRVTTDPSGSFAVNFTMPSDGATIELVTQTPDALWNGANVYVAPYERMNVQVGTLQVGTTGQIVATLPPTGGPWSVDIEFYPSNTSAPADVNAGWDARDALTGLGVRLGGQTVAGPTIDLSLPLPSFLPAGSYYLSIVAYPLNAIGPAPTLFPLQYAYAALVTVQGPSLDGAVLVLATLPIVLAVAAAAWVVERRRKRGPPPERPQSQAPPPPP